MERDFGTASAYIEDVIVSTSNVALATQVSLNPKNTGESASPSGDFSAALGKLFNQSEPKSGDASSDAVPGNQAKRSKSAGQQASSSTPSQTTELAVTIPPLSIPTPQLPALPQSAVLSMSTVQDSGTSSSTASQDATVSASPLPIAQLPVGQMPTVLNSGSMPFSGVQNAGTSFDQSMIEAPETMKQSESTPSPATIQQNSSTAQEQPGIPVPEAVTDAVINKGSQTLDADTTPVGSVTSAGLSDEINGLSQDESGQEEPVQLPVQATPAATSSAAEMLLATAPAMAPESSLPLHEINASADPTTSVVTATPTRSMQPGNTPTAAVKASTNSDANRQPATTALPQATRNAPAVATETIVLSPSNGLSASPSMTKPAASKRSDATAVAAPLNQNASIQEAQGDQGSTASITGAGTGASAADYAAVKQGDSDLGSPDRRSKDEVVTEVAATVVQAPLVQNAPAALHVQGTPTNQPVQANTVPTSSTSLSGNTSAKGMELSTPSTADPQAVVSTSKLLQTLNQSEMRVGMRTSEFGDISIRTSATHDSLFTQISLDHSELATSLAAHIPEMQARLESHGNLEVRIDTAGQNTGTSSSTSDAGSGSQGGRPQDQSSRSYFSSSYSNSSVLDSALPTAAMASTLQNARNDGRIDIQA